MEQRIPGENDRKKSKGEGRLSLLHRGGPVGTKDGSMPRLVGASYSHFSSL
jgi:hypothetical protein